MTSSRSRCTGRRWNCPLVPKPALLHKPAIDASQMRSISCPRAAPSRKVERDHLHGDRVLCAKLIGELSEAFSPPGGEQ